MLENMAATGAGGSSAYGMHVQGPNSALAELVGKGHVAPMQLLGREDHGHFTLTSSGRSMVKACFELKSPVWLLDYQRAALTTSSFDEYTCAELIMHLSSQGWHDKQTPKSRTILPYRPGGEKVWHQDPSAKVSVRYLHALAVADTRFRQGKLKELWRFQLQGYYKCVIAGCHNVLPHQVLPYYKYLLENVEKVTGDTEPVHEANLPGGSGYLDEMGALTGFELSVWLTFHATAAKASPTSVQLLPCRMDMWVTVELLLWSPSLRKMQAQLYQTLPLM